MKFFSLIDWTKKLKLSCIKTLRVTYNLQLKTYDYLKYLTLKILTQHHHMLSFKFKSFGISKWPNLTTYISAILRISIPVDSIIPIRVNKALSPAEGQLFSVLQTFFIYPSILCAVHVFSCFTPSSLPDRASFVSLWHRELVNRKLHSPLFAHHTNRWKK